MTVKVMSYRVLRQHILRFGYVRIKRRNESVINISGETNKFGSPEKVCGLSIQSC